jgi:general secretion pathway protein D
MVTPIRRFAGPGRAGTLFTLAAGFFGTAAAPAQPPDLLDRTQRLHEVAARQVEAETRLALKEASRLERSDPAQAAARLKELLPKLESDQVLPAERRATLTRIVKDRIRVAEAGADSAAEQAAQRAEAEARQQAEKVAQEHRAQEAAKVKVALEAITALRKEGKTAEAKKQADELLRAYPDNVTVQVLNNVNVTSGQIADEQALRKDKEQRTVAALRDIDRSAVPPSGDIEFPKDWKEKTAKRKAANALSAAEVKLLRTLDTPIDVKFKASKLQDVVDYLSTFTGQTILLDKNALDEAQVTYETPINFAPRSPVATRTALRATLSSVGLTYVVQGDLIQITTPSRAKDMMVTKNYYLGDLVLGLGLVGGAAQYGVGLDQAQLAQNVGGIVEMIKSTIDPQSWDGKGGAGTIGFNIPTMSLIVRQSAEVHAMIRGGLYK